jgi:hypothetical protein
MLCYRRRREKEKRVLDIWKGERRGKLYSMDHETRGPRPSIFEKRNG